MADLLPSSPDPSAGDGGEPRVIGVDSDEADDLLAALQSETARDLLATLYDDPATPSELAEEADTSLQNVRYHLEKLTDADLVGVADTVYSEKGREMKVYAPEAKPLVVFAGGEDETPGIESALSSLLGGLGVLGLSSLVVQRLATEGSLVPNVGFSAGGGAGDAAEATTEEATWQGSNLSATTELEQDAATEKVAGTVTEEAATTAESGGTATEATRTAAESTRTASEATRTASEATTTASEVMRETTEEAARVTTTAAEVTTTPETTTVAEAAGGAASGLPPGLLFFAGGAVVLLGLVAVRYLRVR